jgi:hypothetical membrane protein
VKFLRAYAEDFCIVVGLCLAGIGVYRICPVATWFYAGASMIAVAWGLARGLK